MAETHGLSVVHVEPVRRIARRVSLSPAAGRYLAIGASADMRERVLGAFRAILGGPEKVVSLDLSGAQGDPWNEVRRHQQENDLGTRGVLYSVHGLRALAARETSGAHPYAQLNLSRDGWGSTGTHLLVWLEGLEELDRFLDLAPDLWSHRDVVAWFLTMEDFRDPTLDVEGLVDQLEPQITAARETLADPGASEMERVAAATRLAHALAERGDYVAAWKVVEEGGRASRGVEARGLDELALTRIRVAAHLRRALAVQEARRWLHNHPNAPTWGLHQFQHALGAAQVLLCPEASIDELERAAGNASTDKTRTSVRINRVAALVELGRLREAGELLSGKQGEDQWAEAWSDFQMGLIANVRGEVGDTIRSSDRAARFFACIGFYRLAASASANLGESLDDFGAMDEARAILAGGGRGTSVAAVIRKARHWRACWRVGVAAPDLTADLEALAATWAGRGPAGELGTHLVGWLEEEAPADDAAVPWLEGLLRALRETARADHDAEIEGHARWLLARLALLREDRPAAHRLADKALIPWCRRWRGPVAEVDIWRLLARSAPSADTGLDHAKRAVALADENPSIFAQVRARFTLAEVHVRRGGIEEAARALHDALPIARAEGLRRQELDALHRLSELPGHPGAQAAAEEALSIAGALLLPREEARALLNLAALGGATPSMAKRRLDRAREIVEELGPPNLRARLAPYGPFPST